MDFQQLKDIFEALSYAVVVLGVPVALYQYLRNQRRARADFEHRLYDEIAAQYLDFQKLCLQYPYLDVFDVPDSEPVLLTPLQQKEEMVALSLLIAIFERAYLFYRERPTSVTEAQWRGWEQHIRAYFQRENFRRAWDLGDSTSDPRFSRYMTEIERSVAASPRLVADGRQA